MAIYDDLEEINLGNIANDGTGDDLREAFRKTKESVEFLYNNGNGPIDGLNLGLTGESVFKQKADTTLEFRKINSLDALKISVVDDVITLEFDPTGPVDFKGQDITNVNSVTATDFNGNLNGTLVGYSRGPGDVADNPFVNISILNRQVNTFDYGSIVSEFIDPISYLIQEIGVEMGTFANPNPITIDAGTIS